MFPNSVSSVSASVELLYFIGTPGEEFYGGKAIMAEGGAFDDVDMALIVHPAGERRSWLRQRFLVKPPGLEIQP